MNITFSVFALILSGGIRSEHFVTTTKGFALVSDTFYCFREVVRCFYYHTLMLSFESV